MFSVQFFTISVKLSSSGGRAYRIIRDPCRSYDESVAVAMVEHLAPARWRRYRRAGAGTPARPLRVTRFPDDRSLVEAAADRLAAGHLIGWMQGRFENGPRALGNRSILCDPGNLAAAKD